MMTPSLYPNDEAVTARMAYLPLAAAYARGSLGLDPSISDDEAYALGVERGLRMHRFKKTIALPRVTSVIGMLKSVAPGSLLDIGSGRGTFLWPMMDAFPWLPVTSLEGSEERSRQLRMVAEGGIGRLTALSGDARRMEFADSQFDVVTILEVLEHLPDPALAAAECIRVAKRFVVATVPSQPDNNPEHIQLFSQQSLGDLMRAAGAAKVKMSQVHGHLVCLAATA